MTFDFSTISKKITGGTSITVTAEHNERLDQNFEANIEAYTFTIV